MSSLSRALLLSMFAALLAQEAVAQHALTGDCRVRLIAAMKAHAERPDSLLAFERRVRVAMHPSDTAMPRQTFDAVVTVAAGGQMTKGRGFEMISDDLYTIRRDDSSRSVHLLDHRRHRKAYAAQKQVSTLLPDSLVENATVSGCLARANGTVDITVIVEPRLQRFFNADTVRFTLARAGAIESISISHPDASPLDRTEILVLASRTIPVPDVFHRPVREAYFDDRDRLLPPYHSYRILGRDHQSSLSR